MRQLTTGRACARVRKFGLCLGLGLAVVAFHSLKAAPPEKPTRKAKPNLEDKLKTLSKGSSSKEAQQQGLAELPLDKLQPGQREKAAKILGSLSIFRELPTLALETDPQVHQFFLDHPEMAVSIWRAMKISKFEMTQLQSNVYAATDNNGTKGQVEVLYRDQHQILAICDGVVHSPLFPGDIQAQTLLHLQMDFVKDTEEVIWSRNRLRMYVSFPSTAIETAAKMVAPLGNMIIDRNLKEVCLFVGMMSAAMVHHPGWVEHTARRLEGVSKERQEDLVQLTARVFVAARKKELAKQTDVGEVSLEDVLRPLTSKTTAEITTN